jgi:NADPH-dependent glutamate synthase beta subunit-like oxidoreductase
MLRSAKFLLRNTARFYSTVAQSLNVCVVGGGPSGFYTAKYLLANPNFKVQVSMIEKLPTPYGLVRYGVATDHQDVKLVTNDFKKTAQTEGFSFFGNVKVGDSVSVDELRKIFDVVVFCNGSETEAHLGLQGENLKGVESAKAFVEWYNGLPAENPSEEDRIRGVKYEELLKTKQVCVIGQGNVALDVSRVIGRSVDSLRRYDVPEMSLDVLSRSKVEEVHIVGRRGPVQAACSTKELRELSEMPGLCVWVDPKDLELDPVSQAELERMGSKGKRKLDTFKKFTTTKRKPGDRIVQFQFFKNPAEFIDDGNGNLKAMKVEKTTLVDKNGKSSARGTNQFLDLPCGVAFRSIGYRSKPIPGVPFDEYKGRILNEKGRIKDEKGFIPGMYTAGWVKRGPDGVVGTNINCAKETISCILDDIQKEKLQLKKVDASAELANLLKSRNRVYVTFNEYLKLEKYEEEVGNKNGKIREKVLRVEEMLKICKE